MKRHVTLLQLQGRLLLNVLHHLRDVHVLKVLHVRRIVEPVERGDVSQQRGEPLALRIATLKKHLLGRRVDMRILKDGFEIALNAGHGSLQLMRHILGELPLEDVLLTPCTLQAFIDLNDALGNLAQLIVGEHHEILGVQTLVMGGARGKDTELGDIRT